MGSLLTYSGIVTKLRSMQSQLINDEEYRKISELQSMGELVAFLQKRPAYRPILSSLETGYRRKDVEQLLKYSIYDGFERIYKFANREQRAFMDVYFKRYEVSMLKRCFRLALDNRAHVFELERFAKFFRRHSKLNIDRLQNAYSMPELVEALKGSEYYPVLKPLLEKPGATLFDYETAIDHYYFALIWKVLPKLCSGGDLEGLSNAYGAKFALINLNWIYRARRYYHAKPANVYTMLIPARHRVTRREEQRMVEASTPEEFEQILKQTYYARKFPDLSGKTIEEMYIRILKTTLKREAQKHPYSVTTIYSYLYQKEHEVDRLITALECIRYGLEPSVTYQYILKQ